ncbi:Histone-lysine N-methyltransferase SETMAR [Eumeta japonica]|uniref:Histone-lysine N-methyltransferase SETMAR n=1 Tax=Eumeta variegata TaxID=151549 RepID=A0A4C1YCM3_EUMVA|nr:Histone-lysine N-methyltransferase SETMAR [Eumeta japonica]
MSQSSAVVRHPRPSGRTGATESVIGNNNLQGRIKISIGLGSVSQVDSGLEPRAEARSLQARKQTLVTHNASTASTRVDAPRATITRDQRQDARIILHHDNASCHTLSETTQFLEGQKIELMDHPPYGPDLASNDFYLFPRVKNKLRG